VLQITINVKTHLRQKLDNDMKTTSARLGKSVLITPENKKIRTHPVPKNKFGIVARHCISNRSIAPAQARKVFNGPIAAIESDYQSEISKTADFRKCMKEFNPLSVMLKCCPAPLPERTKILF
jgi:hypothetical protein